MTDSTVSLPNLAAIVGPVLQRVPFEQRPLLIAAAERQAANRYRGWSDQVADSKVKSALRACADREDDIARRVESLFPDAAVLQKALLLQAPELTDASVSIFAAYLLKDQFKLQAQGERVGAATWRAYAARAADSQAREQYIQCAILEEESAAYLESLADKQL